MPSTATSALGRRCGRRVGVEIEYGGLDTVDSAAVVAAVLGGAPDITSPHAAVVRNTRIGDVTIKLDLSWAHTSVDDDGVIDKTKDLLAELGRDLVPMEIVAPPIDGGTVDALDDLAQALSAAGATGTRAGLLNGFGLHLYPELWDADLAAGPLLAILQACLLEAPELQRGIDVDITRAALPFVAPFTDDYRRLVLSADYAPDLATLIDDYLAHNPTRNLELDMLPVFTHLDEARVQGALDDLRISGRPTLHWRLPNTDFETEGWSIAGEWERWLRVERLALDDAALTRRKAAWMQAFGKTWTELI
jgi:hypothetical protein